jgi:O-antigen/teichoic acid export membrane protein
LAKIKALNPLKKLAGQTVIYGLSSIVPKFLSYFLVPLHTYVFKNPSDYGVVGDLYGLVVMLNIVLTYGMETAYFWFCKKEQDTDRVYSTSLISLVATSTLFIFFTFWFAKPIAHLLEYPKHPEYIWWFGLIIGIDSICAIPFVKLRRENKAMKFASLKLFNVCVNVFFTIIFLLVLPFVHHHIVHLPSIIYSPKIGVGYIFIANVIASVATLALLYKDFAVKLIFDFPLWKRMLTYALPLLVAGLAGGINDVIDRQFLKYMLPASVHPMTQLGIYFANLKVAVILIVFIQTFRFAAEPFFFNYEKEKDSKIVFADIMKYFVGFCLIIFIGTLANINILKYFVNKNYWSGLGIVPIMLLANLFVGIYLNLSIWYKLSGKTMYGAYIIIIGSACTILINYLFVVRYGYYASAYARLVCYVIMTIICYVLGQKYYRIPYNLKEIGFYSLLSFLILIPIYLLRESALFVQLVVNNLIIVIFLYYVLKREKLLPVLLRAIKKTPKK